LKTDNNLETKIGNLLLKTPLMTSSGTSGSSYEISFLEDFKDVTNHLGAFVTKGVSLKPSKGNRPPRIVEVNAGIINSIGLQNKGAKIFLRNDLPNLLRYKVPIIVNISAESIFEFGELAKFLNDNDINKNINGIEINVSCPNIKKGGISFGVDPKSVEKIVSLVKRNVNKQITIITKLSPNVTDITIPARAAINGGTDVLSMINTLRAMAIDIDMEKPFLGNKIGGLSGPCIKPIGVYMVFQCFRKIQECNRKEIPIIGIGGIANYRDVLEYIMAGASAVGIGTQWFLNNLIFKEIHKDLSEFMNDNNYSLNELIGRANDEKCN
jgi:dihydroorotate dehydrogenase (NAD+) catalytic subunit